MRIGLRVLSNPQWRGGINYIINWSAALKSLPAGERPEIILLPFDAAGEKLAAQWPVPVDGVAPFAQAGELGLDFVYPATQIFEAPFGVPWAGWIPDWQCQYLPDMFSPLERARRDLHYKLLAQEAPALALSSQMALEDTRRLVPSMVEAHVLHFPALLSAADLAAFTDIDAVRVRYDLPERYLIVCNQFWRHKNHKIVLEALLQVASPDLICVMTGEMHDERWPDYIDELKLLLNDPRIAPRVRLLGSISREDQLALISASVAVVQPSLFEGWSTVVEEARLLGVPLLLSDFPVHREQNPPGSRFFDPRNPDALAALLGEVWSEPFDPSRFERAKAAQAAFSAACARAFLDLARATKKNFMPGKHDPVAILARLYARPGSVRGHAELVELEKYNDARARSFFKDQPQHLNSFLAYCEKEGTFAVSNAKRRISNALFWRAFVSRTLERLLGRDIVTRIKMWASRQRQH